MHVQTNIKFAVLEFIFHGLKLNFVFHADGRTDTTKLTVAPKIKHNATIFSISHFEDYTLLLCDAVGSGINLTTFLRRVGHIPEGNLHGRRRQKFQSRRMLCIMFRCATGR
jgi:hypothetical protein